jgi:hypothetical protein
LEISNSGAALIMELKAGSMISFILQVAITVGALRNGIISKPKAIPKTV